MAFSTTLRSLANFQIERDSNYYKLSKHHTFSTLSNTNLFPPFREIWVGRSFNELFLSSSHSSYHFLFSTYPINWFP